jgi:hypothetical protein
MAIPATPNPVSVPRRREPSPKLNGVGDPPFGACAGTEPEAVTEVLVLPEFDLCAGQSQCRNPPLHYGGRCDPILLTDSREGWRVIG